MFNKSAGETRYSARWKNVHFKATENNFVKHLEMLITCIYIKFQKFGDSDSL